MKDTITVTIDRHLHDWIKEKGGKKSRIVNEILHKQWINEGDRPKRQPVRSGRLISKSDIDLHMAKVWNQMGYSDDGQLTLCCSRSICECGGML